MNTELLIVILSIVALHVAALLGGGLALGIMKLFGRKSVARLPSGDAADTVGLGDFADEILNNLYSHWCYPYFGSDLTVRYSENREFVTQLVDNTLGISLEISDNQVTSVFAWSHE